MLLDSLLYLAISLQSYGSFLSHINSSFNSITSTLSLPLDSPYKGNWDFWIKRSICCDTVRDGIPQKDILIVYILCRNGTSFCIKYCHILLSRYILYIPFNISAFSYTTSISIPQCTILILYYPSYVVCLNHLFNISFHSSYSLHI